MKAGAYLALIDCHRLSTLERSEEYADLLSLLRQSALKSDSVHLELAQKVALACMGNHHLWQDLGLEDRATISLLMEEHFPDLFRANSGKMRWKKFFYQQLCQRAEVHACRAPSCAECYSYAECFGSEDGQPLSQLTYQQMAV